MGTSTIRGIKMSKSRKKNNKSVVIAAAVILVLLIAGAVIYTVTRKPTPAAEAETADSSALKEQCISYLKEEHTSEEIEVYLIDRFRSMTRDDATAVVDLYIYGTYQYAMQYDLTDEETNRFYAAITEDGRIDLAKVEDAELVKKTEELKSQHVVLRFVNQTLFWDVYYRYFSDAFGAYLNEDYAALIALYEEEKTVSYCDNANHRLFTDVVEDRLDRIHLMTLSYPSSTVASSMRELYNFYLSVYLGAYGQDYCFDPDGKIYPELFEAYNSYKDRTADADLKAFLSQLVEQYRESGLKRTVPIFEKIKEYVGISNTSE